MTQSHLCRQKNQSYMQQRTCRTQYFSGREDHLDCSLGRATRVCLVRRACIESPLYRLRLLGVFHLLQELAFVLASLPPLFCHPKLEQPTLLLGCRSRLPTCLWLISARSPAYRSRYVIYRVRDRGIPVQNP